MLKHAVALSVIALAAVLMLNSSTPAQGPGPDTVKKLEAELDPALA